MPSGWWSCQTQPPAKTQDNQHNYPLHWVVRENNMNRCKREKSQKEIHSPLVQHLHSLPSHQEGRANPEKKTNTLQNKEKRS